MARSPEAMPPLRVAGILAGVLAAAVLVFSLGVTVGRRASGSAADVGALPPVQPAETIAPPSAIPVPPERMTFYDRLSGQPAPPGEGLPTGGPPPEAEPPAARPPAPPLAAPGPGAGSPRPGPARELSATVAATAPKPGGRRGPETAVERLRGIAGRGSWAVQIAAVSQDRAAEDLAARYRAMGFEAATSTVETGGRTLHRVRVGSFPDRAAAARAAEIFRADLGMPGSIPVRSQ